MNTVDIFFIHDNNEAASVSDRLNDLGLTVFNHTLKDVPLLEIDPYKISVIIIDCQDQTVDDIVCTLRDNKHLHNTIVYVMLQPSLIGRALDTAGNLMHTEFVEKPYQYREFVLLLEKTIVVEKYREIMKQLSSEYEERIEKYEHIFHIKKNDIFESEKSDEAFKRILTFEKNLIDRQKEMSDKIKEFSCFRQRDFLETKDILFANTMLEKLRERELKDAKKTIDAQERVIEFSVNQLDNQKKINEAQSSLLDYSSHETDDHKKISQAQENVVELSRDEAIHLHQRINSLYDEKTQLVEENQRLKKELQRLKDKS